jgi:acyl-CoA thioesterase FadM
LRTWVGQASRLKFERFTEIYRKVNPSPDRSAAANNQLLAQGRTLWVPIDVRTGKPTRVAAELRAQFSI